MVKKRSACLFSRAFPLPFRSRGVRSPAASSGAARFMINPLNCVRALFSPDSGSFYSNSPFPFASLKIIHCPSQPAITDTCIELVEKDIPLPPRPAGCCCISGIKRQTHGEREGRDLFPQIPTPNGCSVEDRILRTGQREALPGSVHAEEMHGSPAIGDRCDIAACMREPPEPDKP